jgi:hypothetical protein
MFQPGKTILVVVLLGLTVGTGLAGDLPAAKTAKLTPAMCEMLGMADEYISRFSYYTGKPRPGFVEHFYPAEMKLADRYQELINDYRKESGLKFGCKRKDDDHVQFHSAVLAGIINSFYKKVDNLATLDIQHLMGADNKCRLRYLQGAYRRHGKDKSNVIGVANGGYKIDTIAAVLKKEGCPSAVHYFTETIPMGHYVFFEPSKKIAKLLGVEKVIEFSKLAERYEAKLQESRK